MAKRKLQRFAEISTFRNVLQPPMTYPEADHPLKGRWREDFFGNPSPIVLELGCGRGEYTVGLARKYPNKNFIGIDIKGARLWRGAKTCVEENISNAGFLRIHIGRIGRHFAENEVDEIWITFPDPQPQLSRERKRLTAPAFLERYRSVLKKGGIIHLKTDNKGLYEYTLEVISAASHTIHFHTSDLYDGAMQDEILSIKTTYEERFLKMGMPIHYIQFSLSESA
jgi:tRNA (guanine-N7-)-methyltransferase